ncbi:MAG: hypothetical protein U5Q44_08275 [Dehalococcoidia bacterium]|nr:hypothetical protein [Dehalococcoidia bacterium]
MTHDIANPGAGAEEDRGEALGEHAVDGDIAAHVGVAAEFDAKPVQVLEVLVDEVLLHLEVRDAVDEHTAGIGPGFEDGGAVAHEREVLGDGEAGRPGADDRHPLAGGLGHVPGQGVAAELLALVVGAEGLELADGHGRLAAAVGADGKAHDAGAFAKAFLRAEAAAHLRKVARLAELIGGTEDVAFFDEGESAGNIVPDGAGFLAGRRGALDTALGLDAGSIDIEAEIRLVEIPLALLRVLLGDGLNSDGEATVHFVGHSVMLARPGRAGPSAT